MLQSLILTKPPNLKSSVAYGSKNDYSGFDIKLRFFRIPDPDLGKSFRSMRICNTIKRGTKAELTDKNSQS